MLTLLPKVAQTKYWKLFWLNIFQSVIYEFGTVKPWKDLEINDDIWNRFQIRNIKKLDNTRSISYNRDILVIFTKLWTGYTKTKLSLESVLGNFVSCSGGILQHFSIPDYFSIAEEFYFSIPEEFHFLSPIYGNFYFLLPKNQKVQNFFATFLKILVTWSEVQVQVLHLLACHEYKFPLKVHKNENFFGFDFELCTISILFMHK